MCDERVLVTVLGGHVPGVLHFICLPCWSRGSCHQCRSININGFVDNAIEFFRFILGLPYRSHIGPTEFSGASMLPVPLRVDQLKLNHMYNIINGIAPSYLKSCRLTWLSSYMYISTIGNYCITGSRYHYEYYKTI